MVVNDGHRHPHAKRPWLPLGSRCTKMLDTEEPRRQPRVCRGPREKCLARALTNLARRYVCGFVIRYLTRFLYYASQGGPLACNHI
jgi:hypothetical protein